MLESGWSANMTELAVAEKINASYLALILRLIRSRQTSFRICLS